MSDWTWARWPWHRCKAVWASRGSSPRRCDLRAGHETAHRSDHGMDDLIWDECEW